MNGFTILTPQNSTARMLSSSGTGWAAGRVSRRAVRRLRTATGLSFLRRRFHRGRHMPHRAHQPAAWQPHRRYCRSGGFEGCGRQARHGDSARARGIITDQATVDLIAKHRLLPCSVGFTDISEKRRRLPRQEAVYRTSSAAAIQSRLCNHGRHHG